MMRTMFTYIKGCRFLMAPTLLTNKVIVYMDDILIAMMLDHIHHRDIIHQVLYRLEEHDLYLKPEKCTFEALEISGHHHWKRTNTNGPHQNTRSSHVGSTNQSYRSMGICRIPKLLPKIHQRLLEAHTTTPQPHKNGSSMEVDTNRARHI